MVKHQTSVDLSSTLGSSKGRGSRAAGWFSDLLQDHSIDNIKSVVLSGGIAGWVQGGPDFVEWIEGYDEGAWKS